MDLPDPLTPVTQVISPSGISTSMSFRLCSRAPSTRRRCEFGRLPHLRHGNRQLVAQVLGGERSGLARQPLEGPAVDDASALLARADPEVDDVVRDRDHLGVVLDDEHRVALVAELPEDAR